jgi:CRP-like cAMP-binding protein
LFSWLSPHGTRAFVPGLFGGAPPAKLRPLQANHRILRAVARRTRRGIPLRSWFRIARKKTLERAAPITNRLLDRLPPKDRARLFAGFEEVELAYAEILAEPGDTVRDIYFPTRSFISLLAPIGGKHVLEVALTGNEGMYGMPVVLGVMTSPVRALVQGGGPAWRMGAARFRAEMERSPSLRACVDGYAHVLLSQVIHTAGCNRFHVVEQRVARWLLMTADRSHSNMFRMTHAFLAYMLGVRRVGITEAASALHRRGIIDYTRGEMTIVDRKALERASCVCYRSDLRVYQGTFH